MKRIVSLMVIALVLSIAAPVRFSSAASKAETEVMTALESLYENTPAAKGLMAGLGLQGSKITKTNPK